MQLTPARFLATHRVFTRRELIESLTHSGGRSSNAVQSSLEVWLREGRVRSVKRGVFVRSDLRLERSDFLALGARLAEDAVLAYSSALELHGLARSHHEDVTFVTRTSVRPLVFEERQFEPIRPRAGVARARDASRWVRSMDRGPYELRVTTRERTIVDCLDRLELAGGIEEVWRSCSAVEALEHDRVLEYVRLLGIDVLAAKVGYFLETHREHLLVPDRVLAALEELRPKRRAYMVRGRSGKLAKRWNLLVPEALIQEEWNGHG
ncbi:MAG: hypothetical protein HZA53_01345 [Planctomycetes bacterium]|nr:hypothetical protein [Planctomycetota bacterium]